MAFLFFYFSIFKPHDTIEEFNVDSKSECDQLNLSHVTQTNKVSAHLLQYRCKIREGSPEGII